MINTILFDLDGTFIPFTQEDFTKAYFYKLVKKVAGLGFDKDKFQKALWGGVNGMLVNDGKVLNSVRFWEAVEALFGKDAVKEMEIGLSTFYEVEFDEIKEILPKAVFPRKIIDELKNKGYDLILATNPLFPEAAVRTRLKWVELDYSDFSFVTHFDNSSYCKPNVDYYREILEKTGKDPKSCMMVGNNAIEDMCASELGMKTYLITDYLENEKNLDISVFDNGTIEEFYNLVLTFDRV